MTHDGYFPAPDEVADMLNWALRSAQDPTRQRLGLALAGRGMSLDFPDSPSLTWRPERGTARLSEMENPSCASRSSFRIPLNQPWWRRLFGVAGSPAVTRLCERTRFVPLRLRVDHRELTGTEFGKPLQANYWVIWSDHTVKLDGEDGPIYYSDHHTLELRVTAQEGDFLGLPSESLASHPLQAGPAGEKCTSVVAWRLNRRPSRVEVVQYGVSLTPFTLKGLPPQTWMVLADSTVTTDLTCLRPVQDEALQAKVEALQKRFNQLSGEIRKTAASRGGPLQSALAATGRPMNQTL